MLWIAHRGASHDAPENTLAAVRLAWEQGADAVEVDVRLTSDQKTIVFHDADTKRICGTEHRVAETTFDDLQRLDAGAWKGDAWKGERIPSLEEVIEVVPGDKRLLVEIKAGPEIVAPFTALMQRKPACADRIIPIGFDIDIMAAIKEQHPMLPVLWVHDMKSDPHEEGKFVGAEMLVHDARQRKLDGLDVRACPAVDAQFVKIVRNAGLHLYVWTVDDPEEARRLIDAGVNGLTTNRPGWLKSAVT